jgi:hypothetical protein
VVSEWIGHADIEFFLQTYAHVLGNDDRHGRGAGGNGWNPGDEDDS